MSSFLITLFIFATHSLLSPITSFKLNASGTTPWRVVEELMRAQWVARSACQRISSLHELEEAPLQLFQECSNYVSETEGRPYAPINTDEHTPPRAKGDIKHAFNPNEEKPNYTSGSFKALSRWRALRASHWAVMSFSLHLHDVVKPLIKGWRSTTCVTQ